jgi:ATP-dependent RNA circularization protein (DNA/RNA ligase family)
MNYPEGQHEFIVFAIWDIDKGKYLVPKLTRAICERHGIKHAPVLGYSRFYEYASSLDELLKKAEGPTAMGGIREGLVMSSLDGVRHFKVISNEWLVKTGK